MEERKQSTTMKRKVFPKQMFPKQMISRQLAKMNMTMTTTNTHLILNKNNNDKYNNEKEDECEYDLGTLFGKDEQNNNKDTKCDNDKNGKDKQMETESNVPNVDSLKYEYDNDNNRHTPSILNKNDTKSISQNPYESSMTTDENTKKIFQTTHWLLIATSISAAFMFIA